MESLNVGLVQYPIVGGLSAEELCDKAYHFTKTAIENNTQLLLFPELFCFDLYQFHNSELSETTQINDMISQMKLVVLPFLQTLAVENNLYIVPGSFPVICDDSTIRNRCCVLTPDHKSVFQDKIFLTPSEISWGWQGGDILNIFDAPWGKTAILICYDSEFPILSQMLAQHNVDIILGPSMTSIPGFTRVRWASQARSVEHLGYVLLTGTSGTPGESDWDMQCQAVVLGPSLFNHTPLIVQGNINESEIVFATLDMNKLRIAKAKGKFYPSYDQSNIYYYRITSENRMLKVKISEF